MPSITFHVKRYDPARDEKGSVPGGRLRGPLRDEPHRPRGPLPHPGELRRLPGLPLLLPGLDLRPLRDVHQRRAIAWPARPTSGIWTPTWSRSSRMPHLPLVKDLVCDMDDFFAKYEYIKPWLIRNSQRPGEGDPPVAGGPPEAQHARRLHPVRRLLHRAARRCGPRRTTSARRRCSRPTASRSTHVTRPARSACRAGTTSAASIAATPSSTASEACPKELNPTEGIQWLKKAAVRRRLFGKAK